MENPFVKRWWRETIGMMSPLMKFNLAGLAVAAFLLLWLGLLQFAGWAGSQIAPDEPRKRSPITGNQQSAGSEYKINGRYVGLRNMTIERGNSDGKFRATGVADSRNQVSEYLGILEQMGLRNYVIEISDRSDQPIRGYPFVVSGTLKTGHQ